MSPSRLVLHLPGKPHRRVTLPYCMHPPAPVGRKLPNGTIIGTDAASPDLFFKFTPWKNTLLAFQEIEIYSIIQTIENQSGIVRMLGVSGTAEHLVRVFEHSRRGPLDRFLRDHLKADGWSIDPGLARTLLAQIAHAMAALHAANLVHRDLKAENILIFDSDPHVDDQLNIAPKLSDFDRAIELAGGEFLEEPVGSLFHMAPELLTWSKYDRKVDVYAFGILMFEVAHGGARPYANVATSMPGSISKTEFADKVVNENYRPVWACEDDALKNLASRCWAPNPDDRPEFQEVFELLKASSPRHTSRDGTVMLKPARAERNDIRGVGIGNDIGQVRTSMEDAVCVLETPDALIAGVFDGLRGQRSSEFAARRLAMALMDELKTAGDARSAMENSFRTVSDTLRAFDPPIESGSTAVIALLREDDLLVAWLGDSPAYLFRKVEGGAASCAIPLVDTHHPGREDEAARVVANGGMLDREKRWLDSGEAVPWGPLRVFVPDKSQLGGVALSRALGLHSFKPAVGDDPEMLLLKRHEDDLFLVLGSDGVFDLLHTQTVYEILAASGSAQQAAAAIIEDVLRRGAPDNASVVVVDMGRSDVLGTAASSLPRAGQSGGYPLLLKRSWRSIWEMSANFLRLSGEPRIIAPTASRSDSSRMGASWAASGSRRLPVSDGSARR